MAYPGTWSGPDTLITARADVVKAAPGKYRIADVLVVNTGGLSPGRPRHITLTKEEYSALNRAKAKERYRAFKAERARLYQFIESLPDNDRELWNRPG